MISNIRRIFSKWQGLQYATATSFKLVTGKKFYLALSNQGGDRYHTDVAAGYVFDDTWRLIQELISRDTVLFDIGANIGTISIPAAVAGARVYAFELLNENLRFLSRAITLNGLKNVTIVHCAVSDTIGTTAASSHSAWGHVDLSKSGLIPKMSIDDFVKKERIPRVDLIKIDIEGSELSALKGMRATLAKCYPDVIIECNALTAQHFGHSCFELLSSLQDVGYNIFRIQKNSLCPWQANRVQEVICADFLATTKTPAALSSQTNRSVVEFGEDDLMANIAAQAGLSDAHKQYVLAIRDLIPQSIALNLVLDKWADLQDANMLALLRRGACGAKSPS